MDQESYELTNRQVHFLSELVARLPIAAALDKAELAEAVGPVFHPTEYREKGRALQQDIELLRAAGEFQAAIRRIINNNQGDR